MSDFSDRPFVAGVITGLRAFRIDALGRLTGVTHQDVWTPGENVGICHRVTHEDVSRYMAQVTAVATGGRRGRRDPYSFYSLSQPPAPLRKPDTDPGHVVASEKCECGFYAYFDGGNDYLVDRTGSSWSTAMYVTYGTFTNHEPDRAPRVGAIVNGYGVVTVGSRGFRAAKAEVVALIAPSSDQARHAVAFAKVRRNYPGLPVFDTERAAVEAYPLTDPEPATPETAEDFWTRAAR